MESSTFRVDNLKIFGSSLRSIVVALGPNQPLLEVPLHQSILNAAGTYFRTDDLARLGQLCGELLRKLHFDPRTRQLVMEKSREFLALEESAECYLSLDASCLMVLGFSFAERDLRSKGVS